MTQLYDLIIIGSGPAGLGSSCIRAESTAEHIDFGKSHGKRWTGAYYL